MLIVQGVPPLGGVKQWWGRKTSYFEAKCVNISKNVGDTFRDRFLEKELFERRVRGAEGVERGGGCPSPPGLHFPEKVFRFCVLNRWILLQNEFFCKAHP